jgi:ADP-ribosyl-[dinitrogen reductase] hydrolase
MCLQWTDKWIAENAAFSFTPYRERATAYVVDTVQTVLHFLTLHQNFEAAMIATVNQGDDADTTGALLGMLAGARCGASRLPRRWLERLQPATRQAVTEQTVALLNLSHSMREPRHV